LSDSERVLKCDPNGEIDLLGSACTNARSDRATSDPRNLSQSRNVPCSPFYA